MPLQIFTSIVEILVDVGVLDLTLSFGEGRGEAILIQFNLDTSTL